MTRSVKQDYDKLRALQAEGKVIEAQPLEEAGAEVISILTGLIPKITAGLAKREEGGQRAA